MSLKAFHVFFIIVCVIFSGWFFWWTLGSYRTTGNLSHLLIGIGSVAGGAGLVGYLAWFLRKLRNVGGFL